MFCELQAYRDDGYQWRTLRHYEGSSYTLKEVREDFLDHYRTAMWGQVGGWKGLRIVEHYHVQHADCPTVHVAPIHPCAIFLAVFEGKYWVSFWGDEDNSVFYKTYIGSKNYRENRRVAW